MLKTSFEDTQRELETNLYELQMANSNDFAMTVRCHQTLIDKETTAACRFNI